jgi:hypothetical protein
MNRGINVSEIVGKKFLEENPLENRRCFLWVK